MTAAVTDLKTLRSQGTWAADWLTLGRVYALGLLFWLATRWLVLVHQGAWPWMNAFVVAAARGIVVGDWNEAVRPQLPDLLGVPLVVIGATEQQAIAILYLLASLVQFGAFVALIRALFPRRLHEQTLAMLIFLLVPYDHSIHHYRDIPVVLASSAIFLLSAHFVTVLARSRTRTGPTNPHRHPESSDGGVTRASHGPEAAARGVARASHEPESIERGVTRASHEPESIARGVTRASHEPESVTPPSRGRHATGPLWGISALELPWLCGAMLLGIWSRFEVLTFVGVLVVLALIIWRARVLPLVASYVAAALVVTASLLGVYRLEGVDPSEAWFYTAHTFLDSTPDSWLTPECQAAPTENCREADGLAYFGPADLHAGIVPLVLNRPLTTVAKTIRSAWDNLWVLFGPNLSTFPGIVPFVILVLAFAQPARALLKLMPAAVWVAVLAVLAESVLPPLSWAPPHPQYHLQLVFPMVVLLVPLLLGLLRMPLGRLVSVAFLVGNAALSAFRYTRYPGY